MWFNSSINYKRNLHDPSVIHDSILLLLLLLFLICKAYTNGIGLFKGDLRGLIYCAESNIYLITLLTFPYLIPVSLRCQVKLAFFQFSISSEFFVFYFMIAETHSLKSYYLCRNTRLCFSNIPFINHETKYLERKTFIPLLFY